MPTPSVRRPRAVVDPPKANLALIAFVENVEQKMTNNINFTTLGTVVSDLTAARTTFSKCVSNNTTQRDVANACTAAKQVVFEKLTQAKSYVNGVAAQASPDQANAIIESSGFRTRKIVVRTKLPIEAKYGGIAGAVLLIALGAGRSAVYYFQVSTDQKTWTACPNVMRCRTTVSALTVGTTYYFRVQTQTNKGLSDWSSVVSFVVR
jgi:hypothetical protein